MRRRRGVRRFVRVVGVRFTSIEFTRVEAVAEREDRSLSYLIRHLVCEALDQREKAGRCDRGTP